MHLTNIADKGHKERVESAAVGTAGAPDAAITITEEMIRRGAEAFLANRSLEYETAEEAAEIVVRAVLGDRVIFEC